MIEQIVVPCLKGPGQKWVTGHPCEGGPLRHLGAGQGAGWAALLLEARPPGRLPHPHAAFQVLTLAGSAVAGPSPGNFRVDAEGWILGRPGPWGPERPCMFELGHRLTDSMRVL